MVNPLRVDPTRTVLLRKQFVADMVRRFKNLSRKIIEQVERDDVFGLTTNAVFEFASSSEQIEQFDQWLQDEINTGVLEQKPGVGPWINGYIRKAYQKGSNKGKTMVKRLLGTDDTDPAVPQRTFIEMVLGGAVGEERIKLLQIRSYADLVNVTTSMTQSIRRELVDGLIQGKSPREVGRALARSVSSIGVARATTIARTETIRAHAEGALDAMKAMGVVEIGVEVEWSSTNDSRRCELCADLEGIIIPIDDAHGLFPRHPNCRCSPIPYVDDEPPLEERRKTMIAAIKKSLSRRRRTKWAGSQLV